jgi:ATP-binding cassette subfamily B protein RaxB
MVASYWGHRIALAEIRRRFAVSLKGATLKSLISMAHAMQMRTRPLKLELDDLRKLATPCILHWDMNHFVVLRSVGRGHAVIHDPAVGERRLALHEVSRHFTGVALELAPTSAFKQVDARRQYTLRSLMGRITGLKRGLAQLLVLGVSLQVCALVAPFYMQWVVDDALVSGDHDLITVLGLGFLLLMLMQAALSAVRAWVTTALSTSLNFQWLGNAFAHLMRLPLTYFEKRHLGDIVSRFSSIQTIQQSLTSQFVEGVIDGLLVVSTLVVMVLYSVKLSLVASPRWRSTRRCASPCSRHCATPAPNASCTRPSSRRTSWSPRAACRASASSTGPRSAASAGRTCWPTSSMPISGSPGCPSPARPPTRCCSAASASS